MARSMEGVEVTRFDMRVRGSDERPVDEAPVRFVAPKVKVIAHLKCHMCGRPGGVVENDKLTSPRFTLQKTGPGDATPIGSWRKLRCETCGGSLYVDEVEKVQVHRELTPEQLFGPEPRKGKARKRERGERRQHSG